MTIVFSSILRADFLDNIGFGNQVVLVSSLVRAGLWFCFISLVLVVVLHLLLLLPAVESCGRRNESPI